MEASLKYVIMQLEPSLASALSKLSVHINRSLNSVCGNILHLIVDFVITLIFVTAKVFVYVCLILLYELTNSIFYSWLKRKRYCLCD